MRILILGGEVCQTDLLTSWARPDRRIVNTYGPTEATVIATYADFEVGRPLTIGKPVPGYIIRIINEAQQAVAPGGEGEIYIGGAALATCYLNQPDLTSAKFVDAVQGRFYRTGDLGRFTDDGNVQFLGRIDTQVKLRGYRIELAEIESALLKFGDGGEVRNAIVDLKTGPDRVDRLVAYVIMKNEQVTPESALRSFMQAFPVCRRTCCLVCTFNWRVFQL